ncbi:hypothetical protein MHAS44199_10910 [Mycolicibacterium hassiacum DSM 44199]|nr:hypothetical protein [Mycolicibacterium hassiacum DSM 44199]
MEESLSLEEPVVEELPLVEPPVLEPLLFVPPLEPLSEPPPLEPLEPPSEPPLEPPSAGASGSIFEPIEASSQDGPAAAWVYMPSDTATLPANRVAPTARLLSRCPARARCRPPGI